MKDLLSLTIDANGGIENWKKYTKVSATVKAGGLTWERKQQPGILADIHAIADTRRQAVLYQPNYDKQIQITFEPDRVALEKRSGETIEELLHPRSSFDGHIRATPWTRPQAFYFAGYAIWTYLNAPFNFADEGYQSSEIEPWEENGEQWRRLVVTFPGAIATHSTVQTFYIDQAGLIRRHDYNVEISGNVSSAHYLSGYTEVQGIMFPTRRRVYVRQEDNTPLQPEPLLVDVHLSEFRLY
nr:hypothetical protein [uncultured Dyadobacter sp.]